MSLHLDAFRNSAPFAEVMATGKSTTVPLLAGLTSSTSSVQNDYDIYTFTQAFGQTAFKRFFSRTGGTTFETPQGPAFDVLVADPPSDMALGRASLRMVNVTPALNVGGGAYVVTFHASVTPPTNIAELDALKEAIQDHPHRKFIPMSDFKSPRQWNVGPLDQRKYEGYYSYNGTTSWSDALEGAWSTITCIYIPHTVEVQNLIWTAAQTRCLRYPIGTVLNHLARPRPRMPAQHLNAIRDAHEKQGPVPSWVNAENMERVAKMGLTAIELYGASTM